MVVPNWNHNAHPTIGTTITSQKDITKPKLATYCPNSEITGPRVTRKTNFQIYILPKYSIKSSIAMKTIHSKVETSLFQTITTKLSIKLKICKS